MQIITSHTSLKRAAEPRADIAVIHVLKNVGKWIVVPAMFGLLVDSQGFIGPAFFGGIGALSLAAVQL